MIRALLAVCLSVLATQTLASFPELLCKGKAAARITTPVPLGSEFKSERLDPSDFTFVRKSDNGTSSIKWVEANLLAYPDCRTAYFCQGVDPTQGFLITNSGIGSDFVFFANISIANERKVETVIASGICSRI